MRVEQEPHRTVEVGGQAVTWSYPEPFGPVKAFAALDIGAALPTPGTWRAAEVLLQFTLASGKQGSKSIPLLEPVGSGPPDDRPLLDPSRLMAEPEPPDPATFLELEIARPTEEWPPPEGDAVNVTVLFSDVYGIASYRMAVAAELRRGAERGIVAIHVTRQSPAERVALPTTTPPAAAAPP